MKKMLLMVVALFATATYAQTEKGNWLVGSDLSLSFSQTSQTPKYDGTSGDKTTTSAFKVTPNINYFVIDNLTVGLGLDYGNTKETKKGQPDKKTSSFAVAPNVTYFYPIGTNLAPFVTVRGGFAMESAGDTDAAKSNGWLVGGKLGIAYFVNQGAALTGYVGYDLKNLTNKADSKIQEQYGTLGVGIGVALFF